MNYKKIYFNLVRKRKKEVIKNEYYENHHIIPRSFGGNNKKNNIVSLTAKEHYIAHLLLSKMFKYNKEKEIKMKFALIMMTVSALNQKRFTSIKFEQLRKNVSKLTSISQAGSKNSQFGKMWITNGLENKSIFKIDAIPEGWEKGRFIKKKSIKEIKIKNTINYENNKIYYTNLYEIYSKEGWNKIKNVYLFSKQNFVQCCKKYVDSFIPQNGKKRGSQQS
jgi:hypothetical protein